MSVSRLVWYPRTPDGRPLMMDAPHAAAAGWVVPFRAQGVDAVLSLNTANHSSRFLTIPMVQEFKLELYVVDPKQRSFIKVGADEFVNAGLDFNSFEKHGVLYPSTYRKLASDLKVDFLPCVLDLLIGRAYMNYARKIGTPVQRAHFMNEVIGE